MKENRTSQRLGFEIFGTDLCPLSLCLGNMALFSRDCISSSKGKPTLFILCPLSLPRLQASRGQDRIFFFPPI